MKNLTVQESYDQRQANRSIPFIDVRTPVEYGSAMLRVRAIIPWSRWI